MNFLTRLINSLGAKGSEASGLEAKSANPATPERKAPRSPQLSPNAVGPKAAVELELLALLRQITNDKVIEHFELEQLANWLRSNVEHGEEIPAITYLWRVVQSVLSDQDVESFEWAMIRSAIARVMPVTQTTQPTAEAPNLTSASPIPTNNGPLGADEWLVIDTETSGLLNPIYAVEIAAQRMKGPNPVGEAFRVFLNHNVDLEPAAIATHGYTRDFLRKKGLPPKEAHRQFAAYAAGRPIASHNLAYDYRRVLQPEWGRLGIPVLCPPAFCTVMLSRRCLPEVSSVSLSRLAEQFRLGDVSHQASEDVLLTVNLFSKVLAPRLSSAGIKDLNGILQFARKTPVTACHEVLSPNGSKPIERPARKKRLSIKARKMRDFLTEILRDGEISNHEFDALQKWIETEGVSCREAERVSELIEGVLQDGKVTEDELKKLATELSALTE